MKPAATLRVPEAPTTETRSDAVGSVAVEPLAGKPASPLAIVPTVPTSEVASDARRSGGKASRWERATRPAVCLSVVGLSVALLAYSVITGSRMIQRPSRAAMEAASAVLMENTLMTDSALVGLRADAEAAKSRLVGDRTEFKEQLARVEAEARNRGWLVELVLGPSFPAPGGLSGLEAHTVAFQMTPASAEAPPSLRSLIEWVEAVSGHSKHAEVTSLALTGGRTGGGLSSVRAEVTILGRRVNDEAPQK